MKFLLVLAVAVVSVLGGQRLLAAQTHHAMGQIIVVTVTHRHETRLPPAGRSGDHESLVWSVRDRHGTTIGKVVLDCRWLGPQRRLCSGEMIMPLGKISVQGSSQTRDEGLFAVTGGVGRYANAGGSFGFTATGLSRMILVVTLI